MLYCKLGLQSKRGVSVPRSTQETVKPLKKNDESLFELITRSISDGSYVFTNHAVKRTEERMILEVTVLDILEGKAGRKRRRNKSRDKYERNAFDWNYCIEGRDFDGRAVRIILTFEGNLMPIITVMWI